MEEQEKMTEPEQSVSVAVMIMNIIGILLGAFASFFVIAEASAGIVMKVSAGLGIVALVADFLYLMRGYKKAAAKFFKAFLVIFALQQLAALISVACWEGNVISVWACAITFALTIILCFGENLGKQRSYLLCGVVLGIYVLSLAASFIFEPGIAWGKDIDSTLYLMRTVTPLILSAIMWVMTAAKYRNKAQRGTV